MTELAAPILRSGVDWPASPIELRLSEERFTIESSPHSGTRLAAEIPLDEPT